MKLLSWNVNGLRAVHKKGFLDWFRKDDPDILCVQETKAAEEQLPDEIRQVEGYHAYFAAAEKKGYSGVALWTREKPLSVELSLGENAFDREGRLLQAAYRDFILFNVYFPNGKASKERLAFKMAFYEAFLKRVDALKKKGRKIVICGDVNTAHKAIDLARPKENEKVSGFLPEERAWIDRLVSHGFLDSFRLFNADPGHYSWWDYKTRARDRNIGWRIDYFFVSDNLREQVTSAFIRPDVMGSDHCPVGIELDL
jgi:exodeoxyribonuclease-3